MRVVTERNVTSKMKLIRVMSIDMSDGWIDMCC